VSGPTGDHPIAVVGLLGGRPVGDNAMAALRTATLVAGSVDQLAMTADLRGADAATAVVAGGLDALDAVIAHDGPACVLASGDPGFFGIARAVRARLAEAAAIAPAAGAGPERPVPVDGPKDGRARAGRVVVHPAPSSVALAFARAGVEWDGAIVRSCHTGIVDRIVAEVARAPVAAVLCGPTAPPETVAAALLDSGARHRLAVVASHLAEAEERVTVGDLASVASETHPHRAVLVVADPEPMVAPAARLGGRPVDAFAHRAGMITKPEVRSVVLGKLDLPATGVLWDLGAGSGSVAVEASLAAPGLRVIAVERNGADADRALANAAALGAVMEVVAASAPDALADLPDPDRVFVGGGGLDVLDAAWDRLRPGGRLVATFAAIDRAAAAHHRLGSLVQVSVDRADTLPDGGIRFAADNPVFVAWGDRPDGATDAPGGSASHASIPAAAGDVRLDPAATVAVGVGCSSDATVDEVLAVAADALGSAPSDTNPLAVVATLDRRRTHPAILALAGLHRSGRGGPIPVMAFPSSLLAQVSVATPSAVVADAVGTPSVAEAAALLAAGPGARLVVTKRKGATATAAVAVSRRSGGVGRLTVVGLGPGAAQHRTPAAVAAVRSAEAVVGYGPYVDAVADLIHSDQRIVRSTMGAESDRADAAAALAAAGWRVAIVSSGDAGVFGMASTVLEAATAMVGTDGQPLLVDVVPGVTAAHAGAAAVGAPLAGAHAAITLSDILVPWERIEAQLRAAAGSGLALALYNPRSKGRPDHLGRARTILADVLAPDTPVAVVTAAGDHGQQIHVATLASLDPTVASMHSVVLVGTVDTRVDPTGRLVTSRHHPSGSGRSVTSVAGDTSDGSPAADAIDPGPSAPPLPAPPPQEGARP